jgi:hypothetical protein
MYYMGFNFSTYNIYRGTIAGNLILLNSVASSTNSYTDLNPPAMGMVYYQIEVVNPNLCTPTAKMMDYSASRSNIVSTPFTGISNLHSEDLKVYPNPFSESVTIDLPVSEGACEISVLDITGRKLLTEKHVAAPHYIIHRGALSQGVLFIEVKGTRGIYRGRITII